MGIEAGFLDNMDISTHTISNKCGIYIGDVDISQCHSKDIEKRCKENRRLESGNIANLISQADIIILAAYWREWVVKYLPETISNFNLKKNQTLLVVGSKDFGKITPLSYIGTDYEFKTELRSRVSVRHEVTNNLLRDKLGEDGFVDVQKLVCNDDKICPVFTPRGHLISYDGGHLTNDGAKYIGEIIAFHPLFKVLQN